jgi:hypothetical protein
MEDVERRNVLSLPVLELRPLGRQARSPSLYRLSYPDSRYMNNHTLITSYFITVYPINVLFAKEFDDA